MREMNMKTPNNGKGEKILNEASRNSENVGVDSNESIINLALKSEALLFGNFILKSGRESPYFFNMANFFCGNFILELCDAFCQKIIQSKIEFDVIFGSAYKGISLVACIGLIFSQKYNLNYQFMHDRKEDKSHGESGKIVGNSKILEMSKKKKLKVIIIDDVITAGTAIQNNIYLLEKDHNFKIVAIFCCLDREETFNLKDISIPIIKHENTNTSTLNKIDLKDSKISASEAIQIYYNIPLFSLIKISSILSYSSIPASNLQDSHSKINNYHHKLKDYLEKYGIQKKNSN